MADIGDYAFACSSPAFVRSFKNLKGNVFARTMSIGTFQVSARRSLKKVCSDENLEAASTASTINISRDSSSNTLSRASSAGSWEDVGVLSGVCQRPHRFRPVRIARTRRTSVHDKISWNKSMGGSFKLQGGSFKLQRLARAVLPDWPAVDDDAVASSKRRLLTFDLDPTTLPSDVLCHLALEMFVSAGLPAGLAEHRVRRFILAVRASMLDNPYHNFYHVFDVMQTTNALATCTGTMARLDAWERFALLSAALCHDMEHPGVTSQFLSKTAGDATRGRYRDIIFRDALLEKHHALSALELMCDRDVGILEGLSSAQYYHFRSSVWNIILATDMNLHFQYINHLKQFAARRAENPAVEMEMDKQLAMELMVKCADISNVVKPAAVSQRWALRVTDEFFLQGDAERDMDMEVSPICDRFSKSRVDLQTGFIDHVAAPLFTLLAAAFPPVRNGLGESPPAREGLQTPLAQLRHNSELYALCSDVELDEARDWEETCSSVAPSWLRAASQQLSSDEEESFG